MRVGFPSLRYAAARAASGVMPRARELEAYLAEEIDDNRARSASQ
jgi:hypothetical protein